MRLPSRLVSLRPRLSLLTLIAFLSLTTLLFLHPPIQSADDAKSTAKFGSSGVRVAGIDRPVEWQRVGLTEVVLYLPVSYEVVPGGE